MKDINTNKAFRHGFTLIELMIVIVILGVLMGTILPRLTGAQARARDTARIADLSNISQALETYYDDNGKYPGNNGVRYCLGNTPEGSDVVSKVTDAIKVYLNKFPTPPSASQISVGCTGAYAYFPLKSKGIDNNGYALISDVETYQKANADVPSAGFSATQISGTSLDSYMAASKVSTAALASADTTNTARTVFIKIKK